MSILNDGGARSRKFLLSIGTSVGIILAGVLCAIVPGMLPLFDTIVGGLIGVLALYSGANLGAKHVLKKAAGAQPEASPPAQ
jgi:hypothetical protein